jgi:hypothetical protein
MKKRFLCLFGIIPILAGSVLLATCLNPIEFSPKYPIPITGEISIKDITSAVLMLTNRSKTVDVTRVSITQPEWKAPDGNKEAVPPSATFLGHPKRLEKKAQYLQPSDISYQVVIDYTYDALYNTPAGTGTKTLSIPLPVAQQIVEYIIYRDKDGVIIIDKNPVNPDPDDTGNPSIEPAPGEGSSPAEIPPQYRDRMAAFIVVNKTNSQNISSVEFKKGESDYTMGGINVRDRQSIALGQGTWATMLKYTRNQVEKVIGPVNSIIIPSNDPQAIREHYLFFYLNKRGEYAVSQDWPPFPNDVDEEDMLPLDKGYGRGMIEIINNSHAAATSVTIQNMRNTGKFPFAVDYDKFSPPVPVQYNRTGYVDVVGTTDFPIEAHLDYLIQVMLETNTGSAIVERKAYIKDQVVTIVITGDDLNINNARGAKVTLENRITGLNVDLINLTVRNKTDEWQSSYYGINTWMPSRAVTPGNDAYQYVMSSTAMPITRDAEFKALITMNGYGVSATIEKDIDQPVLYSDKNPDQNNRTITVTDDDVPKSIKNAVANYIGAKVILENKVKSWPVEIIGLSVWNITNPTQNAYYNESTWTPGALIGNDQKASQMVMNSTAMPITPGATYTALIAIRGSGKIQSVPKTFTDPTLYNAGGITPEQNTRTLTIDDIDVPPEIIDAFNSTRGAKVTIKNLTQNYPVQIIGMTVQNKADSSKKTSYNEITWEPSESIGSGQSAVQMVRSSPAMPITPGVEFVAVLNLQANNRRAEVRKTFNPEVLYSDLEPSRNTRLIEITDSDVPPELQPVVPPGGGGAGSVGAKVTLQNRILNIPVQIIGMTVQNKADSSKKTSYDGSTWSPKGRIYKNDNADQMVYNSSAMPITANDQFSAVVTLYYNGTTDTVTKAFSPEELYPTDPTQNTRTVTVDDNDVPQVITDAFNNSRGARVTIENRVKAEWPVQITNMTVRNKNNKAQKTDYDYTTWDTRAVIRNGDDAVQMVMTSTGMPITAGTQFEAEITVWGNGQPATFVKDFTPTTLLYSTLDPSQNDRTVTVTDGDIPKELQTPVTNTEDDVKDSIDKAGNGDTIEIDGVEWIKVRTDGNNPNLVLLMLKGVTGPCVQYDASRRLIEYGSNPSIKGYVDTWYAALNSPILKRIAWRVNFGTTPNPSWPGKGPAGETAYVSVAFIPRLKDLGDLMKANYYRYWISDINQNQTTLCWWNGIIKENGDSSLYGALPDSYTVHVRPCIWVTTKK